MRISRWTLFIPFVVLPCISEAASKSAVDPSLLTAYVTSKCPSELEVGKPEALSAGVLEALLGYGIDYLVDHVGTALAEAAEADKNGRATKSTVPSYLYTVAQEAQEPKPGSVQLPGCAVIAIADSPPEKWCEKAPFRGNGMCDGATSIGALLKPIPNIPPKSGTNEPLFYAEILFIRSADSVAFMPKLAALYYPRSISSDWKFRGKKPRSLSMTVFAATAGGESALTSINLVLKDFSPSPEILQRSIRRDDNGRVTADPNPTLDKAATPLWHALAKAPAKAVGKADDPMVPINLTTEVREIGDRNVFLEALASVFAKQKDTLKAEARSSLIPSLAAAEEQKTKEAQMTNDAAFDTARAQAFTAETNFRNACAKPTTTVPDNAKSEVLATWNALSAAQTNVRKLEFTQDRKPETAFKPDLVTKPMDSSKTALEICIAEEVRT